MSNEPLQNTGVGKTVDALWPLVLGRAASDQTKKGRLGEEGEGGGSGQGGVRSLSWVWVTWGRPQMCVFPGSAARRMGQDGAEWGRMGQNASLIQERLVLCLSVKGRRRIFVMNGFMLPCQDAEEAKPVQ